MTGYRHLGFLTDYGLADGFVAVCQAVIARLAPAVRIIDISHLIPPHDVRSGAQVLARTCRYLPAAVLLGVVDPDVGTQRRAIAVQTADHVLVGPDNGLLLPAADALGGPLRAVELTNSAFWLQPLSPTFHGRDVFAPVAAHLAAGTPLEQFGHQVPTADLVRLEAPHCHVGTGTISAEVLGVDHFGNIQLAAQAADLASAGLHSAVPLAVRGAQRGTSLVAVLAHQFAAVPVGQAVVVIDADGRVAVAINRGQASRVLGVMPGDVVEVSAAPPGTVKFPQS